MVSLERGTFGARIKTFLLFFTFVELPKKVERFFCQSVYNKRLIITYSMLRAPVAQWFKRWPTDRADRV